MTNLSIVSENQVSENQVVRWRVAKTQHPDADRLNKEEDIFRTRICKQALYNLRLSWYFKTTIL